MRYGALALMMAMMLPAQQPMTFQYFYDDTGQLIKVVDSTGIVIEYVYDAVGNMLEVKRSTVTPGALSVFSFAPQQGTTGAVVTIMGQGFSTTASANQVRFGTVLATVLSATTTQLVVQIPPGAVTGPVSVTVGTQTASSSTAFSVVPVPVITSIRPKIVLAGTTVTNFQVTGYNLGNSTFGLLPLLQPVAATASGVVVNQTGTQATMTLTIRADVGLQFVVAATNSFGASDPFPSAEKTLTIYNLPPGGDADQDGLTNADEVARGTDPFKFDTDGDGFGDGLEVALGSDPLNPASVPNLTSGPRESIGRYVSVLNGIPPVPLPTTMSREAISLYVSVLNGIPPVTLPTTMSREAISLYVSVLNGIPPVTLPTTMSREAIGLLVSVLNAASSGGIPTESVESPARMRLNKAVAAMISRGVSLTLQDYGPDSDQDGIPDRLEELILTDAGKADTDVDGYPDGLEIVLGSDPLEMLSIPLIQRTPEVFGPPLSIQNNGGKVARLRRDIRGRSQ
ncbi:MAG: IPT/TIG domain-containing protein [Bryobacterales bacterium]|nr:IPT/TIG domain-containing protein [Bryobacterales bacterium]